MVTTCSCQVLKVFMILSFMVMVVGSLVAFFEALGKSQVYAPSRDSDCVIYDGSLECLNHCGCGWCQHDPVSDTGKCYSSTGFSCVRGEFILDHAEHCDRTYKKHKRVSETAAWIVLGAFLGMICMVISIYVVGDIVERLSSDTKDVEMTS